MSYQRTINALSVFSTSLSSSQLYDSSLPLPWPTCLLSLLLALLSPPIWALCACFQSWCRASCTVAMLTAINWVRGLIWARKKSSSAATAPYKTMTQWAPGSSLCACVHVRVWVCATCFVSFFAPSAHLFPPPLRQPHNITLATLTHAKTHTVAPQGLCPSSSPHLHIECCANVTQCHCQSMLDQPHCTHASRLATL